MPFAERLTRRGALELAPKLFVLPTLIPPDQTVQKEALENQSGYIVLGQAIGISQEGVISLVNFAGNKRVTLGLPQGYAPTSLRMSEDQDFVGITAGSQRGLSLFTLDLPTLSLDQIPLNLPPGPYGSVRLSGDNRWAGITNGSPMDMSAKIIDVNTKDQLWFSRSDGSPLSFSQSTPWVGVRQPGEIVFIDLESQTAKSVQLSQPTDSQPTEIIWSWDGQTATFTSDRKIYLFDTRSQEVEQIGTGTRAIGPVGPASVLIIESELPWTQYAIIDITTQEKRRLRTLPQYFAGASMTSTDRTLTLATKSPTGNLNVFEFDTANLRTRYEKTIPLPKNAVVPSRGNFNSPRLLHSWEWVLYSTIDNGVRWHAVSYITGQTISLSPTLPGNLMLGDIAISPIPSGGPIPVSTAKRPYIINNSARYALDPNTQYTFKHYVPFASTGRSAVEGLPEGEDGSLDFKQGDLITDETAWWYVRNGIYPINDVEKFKAGTRFSGNQTKIPEWSLGELNFGKEPTLRGNSVLYWDGTLKDSQPDGGILYLFLSGYLTSSQDHDNTWKYLEDRFEERGLGKRQRLAGTYNSEVNPSTGSLVIEPYEAFHTKKHPLENLKRMDTFLTDLKRRFPRSRVIGIGHSLGGFMLFNGALRHPDLFEAVITIDSPLMGLDRSYWSERMDVLFDIAGKECGEYLVELGDDPSTPNKVYTDGLSLRESGVSVFTMTNEDDLFVRKNVSVLASSNTSYRGQNIQLVWQLGTYGGYGLSLRELVTGHGQMLRDREIANTILKIA